VREFGKYLQLTGVILRSATTATVARLGETLGAELDTVRTAADTAHRADALSDITDDFHRGTNGTDRPLAVQLDRHGRWAPSRRGTFR
jgi:hypothetical protein